MFCTHVNPSEHNFVSEIRFFCGKFVSFKGRCTPIFVKIFDFFKYYFLVVCFIPSSVM